MSVEWTVQEWLADMLRHDAYTVGHSDRPWFAEYEEAE